MCLCEGVFQELRDSINQVLHRLEQRAAVQPTSFKTTSNSLQKQTEESEEEVNEMETAATKQQVLELHFDAC